MTDAEYLALRAEALRYIHDAEKRGQLVQQPQIHGFNGSHLRVQVLRAQGYAPLPMLKLGVWLQAVPDSHGSICRACFNKRVGRPLNPIRLRLNEEMR